MDTVPYHPKLWKAYHDSTYTTSSSLDSSSSSSSSSSTNYYYMMNKSIVMEYLYLYIAFFIGVFITIIFINVMNICMRPAVKKL